MTMPTPAKCSSLPVRGLVNLRCLAISHAIFGVNRRSAGISPSYLSSSGACNEMKGTQAEVHAGKHYLPPLSPPCLHGDEEANRLAHARTLEPARGQQAARSFSEAGPLQGEGR